MNVEVSSNPRCFILVFAGWLFGRVPQGVVTLTPRDAYRESSFLVIRGIPLGDLGLY